MAGRYSLSGFWLLAVLAGGMRGQETPASSLDYGGFAFPDLSGTRLLAHSDLPQPASFRTALCSDGHRYPVQFKSRQSERKDNNGRQTAYNFDNVAGNVFTVLEGKIDSETANTNCFLASDRLLLSGILLPVEGPPEQSTPCTPDMRHRISSGRNREVVNCWLIGRPPAASLVLVEFARQGKNALASLVMADRNRMIFEDFPAVLRGQGPSLWRVDDDGVLSPQAFQIVFLLQRGTSYVLGMNWESAEGAALSVLVSNGEDRFTQVIQDYWYQAPV